jgi:D-serine deaminase-like pyridoxal phosphate-dependent protein
VLALEQLRHGAIGVTCAKLGEAEVMAAGGVRDLLISTEITGAAKIARLIGLARQARVITVVDDAGGAAALSQAAQAAGIRLRALVDVDVGQGRTGVAPGEPALALARRIAALPGLELVGLQGYEGHLQHIVNADERAGQVREAMGLLIATRRLLEDAGLPMEIVSTGGTGTHRVVGSTAGVTEIQPGSYVVMDSHYGTIEGLGFANALTVQASVVSRQRPNAAIVDAGYKTLSTDSGPARPRDFPDATYAPLGDEHGKVSFTNGCPLALGDRLALIPSHCDTTINLHDAYYVLRGDTVVAVWPIAARGKVQ